MAARRQERWTVGMLDFLRQFWHDIAETWKKLSLSARVNIALAGTAVMVIVAVVAFTGAPPLYRTLVSTPDATVISQVRGILEEQGIDYKIEQGKNVLVDVKPAEFDDLRLLLAEQNVPLTQGTLPGFESVVQGDYMANQWLQDMKYMVALQGELQKQLNMFEFVDYSQVIIREAPSKLFRNEQQDSEALVTLKLTRDMSDRERKGLVDMVAAAGGPHLSPDDITVMTTEGAVLWSPYHDDLVSIANSRNEVIAEMERFREEKLRRTFQEMGVHAAVTVGAKTDWSEVATTTDEVLPGEALSESIMERTNNSTETLPEGSPGTLANVPEASGTPGTTTLSETESETITNNELSHKYTETKEQPGRVVQFEAAVVIASKYGEDTVAADGTVVPGQPIELTQEELDKYTQIASAALVDGELAPKVTVVSQPFEVGRLAAAAAEAAGGAVTERRMQLAWQISQILGIIAIFFMVRVLLRRVIQLPGELEEEEEVGEIPEATREDMRRQAVSQEITQLAEQNPEMVALLLRAWMNEDDG